LFPFLRRAAANYRDERYQTVLAKIPPVDAEDRSNLLLASAAENVRAQR